MAVDCIGSHGVRHHGGFSLIELMVSMVLGLIVLGGVLSLFLSSRATYETTDQMSRIQENGRFALESIVRDLRASGYLSCSRRAPLTNTLRNASSALWNFDIGLQGFDAQNGAWRPALDTTGIGIDPTPGSDALVMRIPRGDFEPVRIITGSLMGATTDNLTTEDTGTTQLLKPGRVVQISDCNARTVFQVTGNTAGVIAHAVTGAVDNATSVSPGNLSNDLSYAFTDAAELIVMESVIYYLGKEATDDVTSLYRRVGGREDVIVERLVEGVEGMQVLFGESSGGSVVYRRADQVTDWHNVQTARIALLIRSMSRYGTDADHGTYQLLDTQVQNPGDRHLRRVFATTVSIRNAIP
jgi:type IV pilus assembly protein PilW